MSEPSPSTRLKILYVGSYGRSGSTLLGRVLAEAPGSVCLGETRYLWSRGLLDNAQCGCGVPFRSCPFWTAVGKEAFGGWGEVDAECLSEVDRQTNLLRALPFYWAPTLQPRLRKMIDEYVAHLSELYRGIAVVSDARTVVEISKDPTFACLLARMPGSDVRVVHLVRDSRAVAYSWTRRRREPSPIAGHHFMPQFKPGETATKWVAWNLGLHLLCRAGLPYVKVAYEGFVSDPSFELSRIATIVDEDLDASRPDLRDGQVRLGEHHMFSGNPMRTNTGWMALRVDDEWQARLSKAQFAGVTAITWPMLRWYGYRLSRRGCLRSGELTGRSRDQAERV